MGIDKELLEILACPVCKQPIREEGNWLVCQTCAKKYPVRDGIPVMLVEEAVDLDVETDPGGAQDESAASATDC